MSKLRTNTSPPILAYTESLVAESMWRERDRETERDRQRERERERERENPTS